MLTGSLRTAGYLSLDMPIEWFPKGGSDGLCMEETAECFTVQITGCGGQNGKGNASGITPSAECTTGTDLHDRCVFSAGDCHPGGSDFLCKCGQPIFSLDSFHSLQGVSYCTGRTPHRNLWSGCLPKRYSYRIWRSFFSLYSRGP